jgi:hypothetical protein
VRSNDPRAMRHSKNGFHFNAQEFLIGFAEGREGLDDIPPVPRFLKIPAILRSNGKQSNGVPVKSK